MRPRPLRSHTDDGSATVLVVAMTGVLTFVMVALAAVGGLVTAQRRAQAAADLTALAGATGATGVDADACARARRTAAANAARLDTCEVAGPDIVVVVSVAGPTMPGRDPRVRAEARAGPG